MTTEEWNTEEMRVKKRDGIMETVSFDKILTRFRRAFKEIQSPPGVTTTSGGHLNLTSLAMKVIDQLYDGISSTKIDELCAEQCAALSSTHPDFNSLAARIAISSHHKTSARSFAEVVNDLHGCVDRRGNPCSVVSDDLHWWANHPLYANKLDKMLVMNRDYLIDYFGFKTLERSYLLRNDRRIVERPQHMWMRVALGIHGTPRPAYLHSDTLDTEAKAKIRAILAKVKETYDYMSQKYFTHATPTLFNAGTPRPQLSSCFLLALEEDSIDGIYNTLKDCATISKWAGGIGLHIHNLRASGSYIRGTGGSSNGIVPMLRVFNNTAKYVDQCLPGNMLVLRRTTYDIVPSEKSEEKEESPISTGYNDVWIPLSEVQEGDRIYNLSMPDASDDFGTEEFCRMNEIGSSSTLEEPINGLVNPSFIPVSVAALEFDENSFDTVKTVIVHRNARQPLLTIRTAMPFYTLQLTPEHPVFVDDDEDKTSPGRWIKANDIRRGNMLLVYCNTYIQVESVEMEELFEGDLYDLEMATYPNYMTHAGLVHNGGGKRNGSFAIYLEPWHADIELFLQMRKNHGDEEMKARDLFYALWIPDLFMSRIKSGGLWTLFCPDECPGLADVYGDEFVSLYERYESEGRGKKTLNARELWFQVLDAQMETGTPYLCYKDAANKKSNQQNLGTIKSSNLCAEIVEYSDKEETAVCNLASLALPRFVEEGTHQFNFDELHKVTKIVTKNLDKVIDVNYYPTGKTQRSNMRHRPIGVGVQGLADVFMMFGYSFCSAEAHQLNHDIFETIYHAAIEASNELAVEKGAYETFAGSPASQGLLQFDLWAATAAEAATTEFKTDRYNWAKLKERVKTTGLRNSLLIAPMPTASTSQILGYNECIEPITSNIYSRRTLAGEFVVCNKHLMRDLLAIGQWNERVKNSIIANNGSVQHFTDDIIPVALKEKYKTVWELPMKELIDMAATRGQYVCQSQSLNLWLEDPNYNTLTSMHFYAWSKGLKTGIYYLRRRGKHQAQQFTIDPTKKRVDEDNTTCELCSA
jgi:ribonucleoside-diphosphate reductase alpha subunit